MECFQKVMGIRCAGPGQPPLPISPQKEPQPGSRWEAGAQTPPHPNLLRSIDHMICFKKERREEMSRYGGKEPKNVKKTPPRILKLCAYLKLKHRSRGRFHGFMTISIPPISILPPFKVYHQRYFISSISSSNDSQSRPQIHT